MGENSKIEWTDHTFNPWVGCEKISPACDHCYAESWAKRTGNAALWEGQRRRTSEANWRQPLKWNGNAAAAGKRARVFCASLADVFDNKVPEQWRADLFALIRKTPSLDWLLLTKRIGNVWEMTQRAMWSIGMHPGMHHSLPENVWLGATVANQEEAERDIPKLLHAPARVRFLSCEPLLGPIDLRGLWHRCPTHDYDGGFCLQDCGDWRWLSWVIVGGESGPHARPMHPGWAFSLRDQCREAGVPFLFKQWGEWEIASYENGHRGGCMPESGKRYTWIGVNGKTFNPSAPDGLDCWAMAKVGKKKAGRKLEGRAWDEFPRLHPTVIYPPEDRNGNQ
ncbi:MAG TPA: phage Gp37/Gp68 family protein [Steroidobacteraceae bacterium]|nr:phage Gp37/Gp68 family protein [Steroidobacteraceae bacterium]